MPASSTIAMYSSCFSIVSLVISSPARWPSSSSSSCRSSGSERKNSSLMMKFTQAVKCPVIEIVFLTSCSFEPCSEPSGASAAATTFCASAL